MPVLILPDETAVAETAADLVAASVARRPVLGLATGVTMVPLYRAVVARRLDLSRAVSFNLDEYLGIAEDHPGSFRRFMAEHLFRHLPPRQAHFPVAEPGDDLAGGCAAYDRAIAAAGGIELQLLGIGRNGHIGFNEPGSGFGGGTRVAVLSPTTRRANQHDFPPGEAVPEAALTMGIGSILAARRVLLLATGAHKAEAVAAALEGPVTAMLPASALQLHGALTVLLDMAAASRLRHRERYVHEAEVLRRLMGEGWA